MILDHSELLYQARGSLAQLAAAVVRNLNGDIVSCHGLFGKSSDDGRRMQTEVQLPTAQPFQEVCGISRAKQMGE